MKISVIVPVYNGEEFLFDCVDSLLNQTYKNVEIILVDDGSRDSSPSLCDEYAEKYDNIKVFHKENGGQSSARNLGIEKSEGDYISFVDQDDLVDLRFCEIMASLARETGCPIVACEREVVKPGRYVKYNAQCKMHNAQYNKAESRKQKAKQTSSDEQVVSIPLLENQHDGACDFQWSPLSKGEINQKSEIRNSPPLTPPVGGEGVFDKFEVLDTREIVFDEFVKGMPHRFINAFHTKLVRRDLLLKYKFDENLRDEEDTYLAGQLFFECDKIGFVKEKLYFHTINKNSITHKKGNYKQNFNSLAESRKLIIKEFAKRNYTHLNSVVSNIFVKVMYEYMALFRKGISLESEREEILKIFAPYESLFRPFELKLYKALSDKNYLKLRLMTIKTFLHIYMKKAGNIK